MDLTRRTIKSVSWNFLFNIFIYIIVFIRQTILARILDLEVFGIYAFSASIVIFSLALPKFGMSSALLNRDPITEDTDEAAAVFFTLSLVFMLGWAIVIILGGYLLLDQVYYLPLTVLVLMKGLDLTVSQTPRMILVKQVTVRRIALLRFITMGFSLVVSTILAVQGFGIWALLATDVLYTTIMIIGLYFWRPFWKPRILWIKDKVSYFLDLGRKNLVAELLANSLDRLDDIWTGFSLGELQMAFYSKAYNYTVLPKRFLADPMTSVIRGSFAELKGDRSRLSKMFSYFLSYLLRLGFFTGGMLFLIAPEFIIIFLGERWLPMLEPFQLMLVFTLINPINLAIGHLYLSTGRPELIMRVRVIQLVVLLIGLFSLGNLYGIIGVAIAVNAMALIGFTLQLVHVRNFVDYSIRKLFLTPLISLGAGLGLFFSLQLFISPESLVLLAVLKLLTYSIGFISVFVLLERNIIRDEYLPLLRRAFQG